MREEYISNERMLGPEGEGARAKFLELKEIYGRQAVLKYIETTTDGVAQRVIEDWLFGTSSPSVGIRKSIINCLKNYQVGDFEALGLQKLNDSEKKGIVRPPISAPNTKTQSPVTEKKKRGPKPKVTSAPSPKSDLHKEELLPEPPSDYLDHLRNKYIGLTEAESAILNDLKKRFRNTWFTSQKAGYDYKIIFPLFKTRYLHGRINKNEPEFSIRWN